MTLYVTPAMMHEAYRLLCTTPPFKRWRLPRAGDVLMVVTRDPNCYGAYREPGPSRRMSWGSIPDSQHVIEISARNVGSLPVLLAKMAHEVVHMRDWILGERKAHHGARFHRLADQVCRHHSFDRRAF